MTASVVARAPGRVNLIGEHTDYNAGLCLPIAIPVATTARARRRPDDTVHLTSAQQERSWTGTIAMAGPGAIQGWAAYAAGVLWAMREAGHDVPGLDLHVESTVPLGAGLSSSASLEAAVALVACAATGREVDEALRRELVAICCRAESEVVGAPTGGLDQNAVLLARSGHALLLDFRDGSDEHVPFDPGAAGLSLVVVDTRVSHDLTDGGYGSRREECTRAAAALGVATLREADRAGVDALDDDVLRRRARHVVTENARVRATVEALGAADWPAVGALLCDSHVSMRDDFAISCAELDLVVDTVLEAGALGARMTGGGFGGSAVALVPTDRVEQVRRAVDARFERAGYAAPGHLDGTPSAAAAVVPHRTAVPSPRG